MKDKKQKVIVVGYAGEGRKAQEALNHASISDVVVMCEPNHENLIEVEGVKYREIEKPRVRGRIATIMLMAQMMGGGYGEPREPQRPDVDIVSEYKLIQQKKSNLSRSQRDWVVSQFQSLYKAVIEH